MSNHAPKIFIWTDLALRINFSSQRYHPYSVLSECCVFIWAYNSQFSEKLLSQALHLISLVWVSRRCSFSFFLILKDLSQCLHCIISRLSLFSVKSLLIFRLLSIFSLPRSVHWLIIHLSDIFSSWCFAVIFAYFRI